MVIFMCPTLRKEADAMICVLYKEYLARRKNGISHSDAIFLGDDVDLHAQFFSPIPLDDVTELLWSLHFSNLIHANCGDDRASDIVLTDDGIVYMEGRFKGKIDAVLHYLATIKNLLPIPFVD